MQWNSIQPEKERNLQPTPQMDEPQGHTRSEVSQTQQDKGYTDKNVVVFTKTDCGVTVVGERD